MADKDEYRELVKKVEKTQPRGSMKQIEHPVNEWDYMELTKIKGIGVEIAKDINRAFPSENALIGALKDDMAPFRNDIVKKLKLHFQIN